MDFLILDAVLVTPAPLMWIHHALLSLVSFHLITPFSHSTHLCGAPAMCQRDKRGSPCPQWCPIRQGKWTREWSNRACRRRAPRQAPGDQGGLVLSGGKWVAGCQTDGRQGTQKGKGPSCSKTKRCEWALQKHSSHVWMWNAKGLNLRNKQNHETTRRTWDFILKVMGDHWWTV